MTSKTELWYLTRGSGAVALVVLTAAMLVGTLSALRARTDRWPRFAVGTIHRNLTLLSIVFVALHVVTTVADGYAPIGLKDAIVPFASPYRPIWLGLGAVAFDLVLALVITSYLRHRMGFRTWRLVHWLSYAAWPVAVVHSLGTGSDARMSWLVVLGAVCCAIVLVGVVLRIVTHPGALPLRAAAGAAALVIPLALAGWYESGPAQKGWAARSGTPTQLRASSARVRTIQVSDRVASPPGSFTTHLAGTMRRVRDASGREHVIIVLRLAGGPRGALRLELRGVPTGGGVALDASGVSFVPATTRAVYYGHVTSLDGDVVGAEVRDAAGDSLQLNIGLSLDAGAGTATGTVEALAQ
ncbi:MAG TPA: ferric reductase-like transmembrane domain-containing protein [Gaiellaceae bacterium]